MYIQCYDPEYEIFFQAEDGIRDADVTGVQTCALPIWTRPFGFYVHVPFCAARCGYCDFNTYVPGEEGAEQRGYVGAVLAEIDFAARVLGTPPPVDTVFFGGGTPTL